MPVNQFRRIGVINDIHNHRLAFSHAEHRTWGAPVVCDGADEMTGCDLDRHRSNAQREIRLARRRHGGGRGGFPGVLRLRESPWNRGLPERRVGVGYKVATLHDPRAYRLVVPFAQNALTLW